MSEMCLDISCQTQRQKVHWIHAQLVHWLVIAAEKQSHLHYQ